MDSRTSEGNGPLEKLDWDKFFKDTGIPVLDPDKVVISVVASILRSSLLLQGHMNSSSWSWQSRDLCRCIRSHRHRVTSLGVRKGGTSVDVMGSELGCDFFDDIFKWVVGKVTCEKPFKKIIIKLTSLEYFAFPELHIRDGMSIKLSARNQRWSSEDSPL